MFEERLGSFQRNIFARMAALAVDLAHVSMFIWLLDQKADM